MIKKVIPILEFRDELNKISPSFCAAKWQQVTMHLHTGHTHSCHHPRTHKIPLSEIESNPSALHNTSFKKLQRKKMLEGERPEECDYCWRIEDSNPDSLSDRTYKSSETWSRPYIENITKMPWDSNVIPTYIEVSFSNVCNLKCSYCSPQVSSKWMEEIERFGPYPTSTEFGNLRWLRQQDAMPIPHKDENLYVEAFWKWWPEVYTQLVHFRITGGEPLMSKDTMKILDYVIEHPQPNLHLSINTNMCVPDSLLSAFLEKVKIICEQKKVKRFKIFTSADTAGAHAEYIRNGLDYSKWLSNIRNVLNTVPGCSFNIMSTYNALSVPQYKVFLQDILDIKKEYYTVGMSHPVITIDTPYLRWPAHQSIYILPNSILKTMEDQIKFMYDNLQGPDNPYQGFFKFEADKFARIYELVKNREHSDEITQDQKDFVLFVDEHDKRRGTNFLSTFPEFAEIYHTWKQSIN